MSLPHRSIATIDSPEFINLQPLDVNPLMSRCEIKVFYLGENRNGTFIKKDVAMEMAKTLRGAPIVGYYKEDKEDFADHGHKMIWDDEGIHFECMTTPYGFVAPDSEVWFQKFNEEDSFGNPIVREYLMTTGYLWTGQFPEVQSVIDEGKPQSMELDNESMKGEWGVNDKGFEFFIINDAIVSKLCILGDDVEPCFEGAAVTGTKYTLDDSFKSTLFSMMKELEYALKGEHTVEKENLAVINNAEDSTISSDFVEENETSAAVSEDFAKDEDEKEDKVDDVDDNNDDDDDKDKADNYVTVKDDTAENRTEKQGLGAVAGGGTGIEKEEEEEDGDEQEPDEGGEEPVAPAEGGETPSGESTLQYAELEKKYAELETAYNALVEFKNKVEDEEKDALIRKFYMLSDEDKKDVIENKRDYSLEDIEAKLAVICYRKKVNFDLADTSENDNDMTDINPVVMFSVDDMNDSTPDWVKEVEKVQNSK